MYVIAAIGLLSDIIILVFLIKQLRDKKKILDTIKQIKAGNTSAKVDTKKLLFDNKALAEAVNSTGRIIDEAVQKSIKDEKQKASLITNVSHDIKTPLTSIINYVGLLKKEPFDSPNTGKYLDILEAKSYKLKALTENLVEVSRITSGNIPMRISEINFSLLLEQSIGEFYDRFQEKELIPVFKSGNRKIFIDADPGQLWRVIENLFGNICKYALRGTIVHIELKESRGQAVLVIKNVSEAGISLDAEDLSERFIRGDESRNSEGYGLGLSIVKSLTELLGGEFKVKLEGDLFKTVLAFETNKKGQCNQYADALPNTQ